MNLPGNLVQHRLVWSAEGLMPKFSKVSPGAGFKRLFSKQAGANFIKGLIKLALIGSVIAEILFPVTVSLIVTSPETASVRISLLRINSETVR